MPRKKKSKKEQREELKKKRLEAIINKKKKNVIVEEEPEIDELIEEVKNSEDKYPVKASILERDEYIFKAEKNAVQKELDKLANPTILEMPEFLTNPDLAEQRIEMMAKLKHLLKRRFSLTIIADVLETNDYSKLDEIIEQKEETYKAVEKYTSEEGKTLRLFSSLKKVVGDEYSRTYSEQEERMGAALKILSDGTYFENAKIEGEDVDKYIEDIVARVIDDPEFNLACQIENEFVINEMMKACKILGDLRSRVELQELVNELIEISKITSERAYACEVMDRLMNGKNRKVIPDEFRVDLDDDGKGEI